MYDLSWTELEYSVLYRKASREFPFHVVLAPIPDDDLLKYERAGVRPFTVARDGGTVAELGADKLDEIEDDLFNRFFIRLSGPLSDGRLGELPKEELLAKIPVPVKRAVIRYCVGGVLPKTSREELTSFDDLADNRVTVIVDVNGEEHELTHILAEPSAQDELDYRRAVAGRVKTLPGRRQVELLVLEKFSIYPEMYGRLIQSVDGYCLGEVTALTPSNQKDWAPRIPYPHKKVAVRQLFGLAEVGGEEESGEA